MDLKEAKARAYDCMTQIEFWRQELAKANQLVNKALAEQEQAEVKQTAEKLDRARGKADAMENKTKTN